MLSTTNFHLLYIHKVFRFLDSSQDPISIYLDSFLISRYNIGKSRGGQALQEIARDHLDSPIGTELLTMIDYMSGIFNLQFQANELYS